MSVTLKANQIKPYYGKLYSKGKQYGWNAPLRLIKEGIPKSTARYTGGGGFPNFGNIITNVTENKPCLLPDEYRTRIVTGYDRNTFFDTLKSSPVMCVRDAYGGAFTTYTGLSVDETDAEILEMAQKNDVAVYLKSIKTVAETRTLMGSTWHTIEPMFMSGAFEHSDPVRNPAGTETKDIYASMVCSSLVVKGKITGTLGVNQNGSMTFTADDCTDYDDWLVVDASELYARRGGSTEPREKVKDYEKYLPKVMYQCTGIGAVRCVNKTDKRGLWNPPTWGIKDDLKPCAAYGYITIPDWGVPDGDSIKNWNLSPIPTNHYHWADYFHSTPPSGTACGAYTSKWLPDTIWLRGHFNTAMFTPIAWDANTVAETGGVFKMVYDGAQTFGGEKITRNCWITPPMSEKPSSSILTDIYGAVQLIHVPKNKFTASGIQAWNAAGVYGTDMTVDARVSAYTSLTGNFTTGGCRTFMAFPDKQHIIDFFKDWGILASENLEDVELTVNPDTPDDPYDPEGFGPWDPGAEPTDPWDNPTPNDPTNPDGPIVDYDPTNPGVEPVPPQPGLVSPSGASSTYIMNATLMSGLQDWMLGDEFWKDASNLFTNKMSAINALTLFPFDVRAHDPNSAVNVYNIWVAGANYAWADTSIAAYKMGANFDSRVRGGEIVYGKDWKSIHGTYRAFSNATYNVYIPFVGMVPVPASACIYRTLVLDYAVDYVSGQATAILTSRSSTDNGYIVSVTPCQMGLVVPLYSDNYTQRSWAIMTSIVGGAVNGVAGGMNDMARSEKAAAKMKPPATRTAATAGALGGGASAGVAGIALQAVAGAVIGGIEATVANPIEFSHTGAVSPMNSWAVGLTPQLVVTEQVPAIPNNYEYLVGQPTSQRGYLYKFSKNNSNYVEAYATKTSINATGEELTMIIDALKGGVFI